MEPQNVFTVYIGPYIKVDKTDQLQGVPDKTLCENFEDVMTLTQETEEHLIFTFSDPNIEVGCWVDEMDYPKEIEMSSQISSEPFLEFLTTHSNVIKLLKILGKNLKIKEGVLTFLS